MMMTVKAQVVATVKFGRENDAAQKIRQIEKVADVLVTYDLCEIVILIEAKSSGQMDKIVINIRQMAEIQQVSKLDGAH